MNDFILNGHAHGGVAAVLMANGFDPRALRPILGPDDRSYIAKSVMVGNKLKTVMVPTNNAAVLRHEEWKLLDTAVVKAAKERLTVVNDLRGLGLQFTIPDGMSKTVLMTEAVSDITEARTTMDPAVDSEEDRPEFDLVNLPLPVTHKGFSFSSRQIMASRGNGPTIDTTTAELAAVRVAEEVEKLTLGTNTSGTYTYGGGTVYGFTNFASRQTKSNITAPTAGGWTGATTVGEVLAMRQLAQNAKHYGPYRLYCSPAWDQYMDADYSTSKGDNTLRERIAASGIPVITADFLGTSAFILILVSARQETVRMVVGLDVTTVQWESMGGFKLHFKVMAIMVPQLRADFAGNCGIVHGTTS